MSYLFLYFHRIIAKSHVNTIFVHSRRDGILLSHYGDRHKHVGDSPFILNFFGKSVVDAHSKVV
ncbi:MAG: hypothetical protein A3B74_01205 [Candidatus Kerfeldbacteria bacterium RIFCSPHIGHO2_02_FULL_42_14]|uniref:Uncharacterized protein n=1 Tax=Candidatus Kerfeldbacteria bacterium RIFCSPHIGHO2_02_FULL_42_14 TaxID=1798540 RepID=A0A1G2AP83_9BACT|nr:MAG: hypothetical protein A3B74_01205 [Candidatus Kerfeldbacteria bacterium RIFCSPHIGHO2_02_FULL_42_14]OGY81122.1 MAG: hypothetical protein A3E60_04670 [Candidatus Kerfeldbacteria bacterium RIFCSPHIGHO2_12_FULL_42_13]OGY84202.1 MAG: hypothetical protein A3I91_05395 [Candidatus Kerfeldbacteria bacterium RIFCSPLOWO2_02_FULL_42_19]OGY87477.1 MAG: hypothetical protein A3G01_02385 [Candidatus Kerfeldbacteria bacterium RIFCSPLOWO2_12_FULL_43_9]